MNLSSLVSGQGEGPSLDYTGCTIRSSNCDGIQPTGSTRISLRRDLRKGTAELRDGLNGIKATIERTVVSCLKHNQFNNAAALSFFFLLSLSPLLIFLVSLMALLPVPDLDRHLLQAVSQVVPLDAMKIVGTLLTSVFESNRRLLSFGILGAIWAGSTGFNAMVVALNCAYQVKEAGLAGEGSWWPSDSQLWWVRWCSRSIPVVLGITDWILAGKPYWGGGCTRRCLAVCSMVRGGGIHDCLLKYCIFLHRIPSSDSLLRFPELPSRWFFGWRVLSAWVGTCAVSPSSPRSMARWEP